MLTAIRRRSGEVLIPAPVVAQVIRNPARQVILSRFLQQRHVQIVPLRAEDSFVIGELLGRTRTSDVVDAHVVLCAQRAGHTVVTSDPTDIRRLAPDIPLLLV